VLKRDIKNLLLNLRGFKSRKKIIVLESDDWGAIRMPSMAAYNDLLSKGIGVDECGYNRFDNLETEDDLIALKETLYNIKNANGESPVVTANVVMANPDFEKIKASGFSHYYFESIDESHRRINGNTKALDMLKVGGHKEVLFPQLHGREHVFINNWLADLRVNDFQAVSAFNNGVFGLSTSFSSRKRKSYLAALDFDNASELIFHEEVLIDAQRIFEKIFGFSSRSFIAPNYTWHPNHEMTLTKLGVKFLQGGRAQRIPVTKGYQTVRHYMGELNNLGQIYLIRNSSFEPSTVRAVNWHKRILREAQIAFALGSPLVISTHRVNFMGGIVEENRTKNLHLLKEILQSLVQRYPDIEFLNSTELGDEIEQKAADEF
jgi:hypothetical protein